MENKVFINESFTKALNDYLTCKNNIKGIKYNSFVVVVIRMLIIIYDELDITNPYDFNNENMLYNNLTKFGYSKDNIIRFFELFNSYNQKENKDDFINIQKMLIDMMMQKKKTINVMSEELEEFRNLLYSNQSSNPLQIAYNFLLTGSSNEVLDYFDQNSPLFEKKIAPKVTKKLNIGAYEALKYSIDDIENMNADELEEVNKKVYNYFEINENAVNSDYLLDRAVIEFNKPKLATNGGFVNILLFLAVISTVAMIIAIITFTIL